MRRAIRSILALPAIAVAACAAAPGDPMEVAYQKAMDPVRIKHVDAIVALVMEYFFEHGRLPLADRLRGGKPIVVAIARGQPDPTEAAKGRADFLPASDLEAELSKGLGRTVELPRDPQRFASFAPNLYEYVVEPTRACVHGNLYGPAPNAMPQGDHYVYGSCALYRGFDRPLSPEEERHQRDADIVRARHLVEWAQIIEAYHAKAGRYPLQERAGSDRIVLVQIATREQQAYLDPGNPKYARKADNKGERFTAIPVRELVEDVEAVLGRPIEERYDPQDAPNGSTPFFLSYFVDRNGYLIWTACQTCPAKSNSFTTLARGTPTINVGSSWYIENLRTPGSSIRKIQSIDSLQANREFVEFVGNGPARPEVFEALEKAQAHESKH